MAGDKPDIIIDPGGNGLPLGDIYAWITVHGPQDQSITALNGLPMVMQRRDLAEKMRPVMRQTARASGKRQRLVRLEVVEVIEEV